MPLTEIAISRTAHDGTRTLIVVGGYLKRCAGIKTYFKAENPEASRVQAIFIGDAEIDRKRIYKAAYITDQAYQKPSA